MPASNEELLALERACLSASTPNAATLAALLIEGNKILELHHATSTDLGRAFAIFVRHCKAHLQVSELELKAAVRARMHTQSTLSYLDQLPD